MCYKENQTGNTLVRTGYSYNWMTIKIYVTTGYSYNWMTIKISYVTTGRS